MALRRSVLVRVAVAVAVVFAAAGVACATATGRVHRHLHRSHVHTHHSHGHSHARDQHVLQPTAESVAEADADADTHASVSKNLNSNYRYPLLFGEPPGDKTGIVPFKPECGALAADLLTTYKLEELQGEEHRMFGVMVVKPRAHPAQQHVYVAMSGAGKLGDLAHQNGQVFESAKVLDVKNKLKFDDTNHRYTVHVYGGPAPHRPAELTPNAGAGGIPYRAPNEGRCSAHYGWSGDGADAVVQYTPSRCTADELAYQNARDALLAVVAQLHRDRSTPGHSLHTTWSSALALMMDGRAGGGEGGGPAVLGVRALRAAVDAAKQQRAATLRDALSALERARLDANAVYEQLRQRVEQTLRHAFSQVQAYERAPGPQRDDLGKAIDVSALRRLVAHEAVVAALGVPGVRVGPAPPNDLTPEAKAQLNLIRNVQVRQQQERQAYVDLKISVVRWFDALLTSLGDRAADLQRTEAERTAQLNADFAEANRVANAKLARDEATRLDAFVASVGDVIAPRVRDLAPAALARIDQALRAHPTDPFSDAHYPEATGSLNVQTDTGYPYGVCAGSKLSFMASQLRVSQHDIVCVAELWSNPRGTVPVAEWNSPTLEQWGPFVPSCATCRQVMRHFMNARPA